MRKFKVAIVKRGKENLWREYWINSDTKEAPPKLLRIWVGRRLLKPQPSTRRSTSFNAVHPDCTVMLAGGEHHID